MLSCCAIEAVADQQLMPAMLCQTDTTGINSCLPKGPVLGRTLTNKASRRACFCSPGGYRVEALLQFLRIDSLRFFYITAGSELARRQVPTTRGR